MSVRMALAKLTACAAGGAVIGGVPGNMVESPKRRPRVMLSKLSQRNVQWVNALGFS